MVVHTRRRRQFRPLALGVAVGRLVSQVHLGLNSAQLYGLTPEKAAAMAEPPGKNPLLSTKC